MHYFKFNIGDHAKDSQHLSNTEDLALRRLKELQYETEEPISLPIDKLARKLRMRGDEESIEIVLDEFFEETKKGWINQTIMEEVEAYHLRVDSARENGKKGGRKPKERTEPEPNPNQPVTEHQANHKPLTINQEPVTNNQEPITTNQQPGTKNESDKEISPTAPVSKPKKLKSYDWPKPEGVEQQHWDDWLQIRKAKRLPISKTVMDKIEREAGKASLTLGAVIKKCAEKPWAGFEASWLTSEQRGSANTHDLSDIDYDVAITF